MNRTRNIAVIGAGLAGLSAATALTAAQQTVTLFERSTQPGGRLGINADTDLGAQYFTVRHAAFHQATRDWQAHKWIAEWSPRVFYYTQEHGLQPSTDDTLRQVGTPGMQALARHLADVCQTLSLDISHLQPTAAGQWLLLDAENAAHGPFDQVVIATTPDAATPLLEAAPQLQHAVSQVRMLPCWSLAARFAGPLPTPVDACFVRTGALDWIARNNSKPERGSDEVWTLQSTADWAQAHASNDPAQVTAELLTALGNVLDLPELSPAATYAHFWAAAKPAEALEWGALAAPELGIYVCGDWCLGGRIENAWLSGLQAAQALLEK